MTLWTMPSYPFSYEEYFSSNTCEAMTYETLISQSVATSLVDSKYKYNSKSWFILLSSIFKNNVIL